MWYNHTYRCMVHMQTCKPHITVCTCIRASMSSMHTHSSRHECLCIYAICACTLAGAMHERASNRHNLHTHVTCSEVHVHTWKRATYIHTCTHAYTHSAAAIRLNRCAHAHATQYQYISSLTVSWGTRLFFTPKLAVSTLRLASWGCCTHYKIFISKISLCLLLLCTRSINHA